MEQMLDSVEQTKGFLLRRVRAYETMESIQQQNDDIVSEIEQLLKERKIEEWNIESNPAEYAISNEKIRVSDRFQFDKIIDLCRCFGKNYKAMQRSFFPVGHGYYIWCPKLAVIVEGKKKAVTNGWINTLSSDWDTIIEENDRLDSIEGAAGSPGIKRATFAKSKDILARDKYRFIGVYQYDKDSSTPKRNVYKRVDTEINLKDWFATKQ